MFKTNLDNESFKWTAISRVSSGFSIDELAELSRKLSSSWKRVYPGMVPPNIDWGKEKPDLWIEPESSVILQVKINNFFFEKNIVYNIIYIYL